MKRNADKIGKVMKSISNINKIENCSNEEDQKSYK